MSSMFEALDSEARRLFFGTVMDVFKAGRREVEIRDILAAVLRAPSLANVVRKEHVDLSGLLARLAAPSVGSSAYDALQRAIDADERDASAEDPFSDTGLPPAGGFVMLPLAAGSRELFQKLSASLGEAPPESVTPQQLFTWIVQSDEGLRRLCAEFGLTVS